jgi:DNA-binding MarR family transcriptional regulator
MSEPLTSTPHRLEALPTWQLSQASVRAHALLSAALAEVDARGHHYRLLAALDEIGPASQAVLGRATSLDRSDVAVGLAELERRELVERRPDPGDRRRNSVGLTRRGMRLLRDLDAVMLSVQEEFLAPLSPRERTTLVGLLQRLATPPAYPG